MHWHALIGSVFVLQQVLHVFFLNSYLMEASILRQDFEHTISIDIELRSEKIEVA